MNRVSRGTVNVHTVHHITVGIDLETVGMVGNRPKEKTYLTFLWQ